MIKFSWDKFKEKNENQTKAFEDLCYYLFCREFKIKEGIEADFNQAGLETEPILYKGKHYGFQSKFFDHTTNYAQIKKSVKTAITRYQGKLDYIYIYLNTKCKLSSKSAEDVEKTASKSGIEIKWLAENYFKSVLSIPSNIDLMQSYFDKSDELGFVKNSINKEIFTFIQSREYLELPLVGKEHVKIKGNLHEIILTSSSNIFLVTGNPGSGKSILMHKLLQKFGGLDKEDEGKMVNVLIDQGAIPVLVNLKYCANNSLESILRGRQNDNRVKNKNLGFIYLFDGLDELNEDNADHVLTYIKELIGKSNTKKIVFTCRLGNINKFKAKYYFNDMVEYKIDNLDVSHIKSYFDSQNNELKKSYFKKILKSNIIHEVKDALFVKLLWETIDKLDGNSSIIDLLNIKIDLLLKDAKHKKNLESLNILNPKNQEIMFLNQEISFEFYKNYQFHFSLKELQELIKTKYSMLDHKSINELINYNSDLFFENSYDEKVENSIFIYHHRRYHEFFFIKKLILEYEKDPMVLRKLNVLSKRELFENFFLKYYRRECEKNNYLIGLIELNLIDVYLGKHKGWGADGAYYKNSHEFLPTLSCQCNKIFNELVEDESFEVYDFYQPYLENVRILFEDWKKNKRNRELIDSLTYYWNKISFLIELVYYLDKNQKKNLAREKFHELYQMYELFIDTNFLKYINNTHGPQDNPFWNQIEKWFYLRLLYQNISTLTFFKNKIRKNYDNVQEYSDYRHQETGKEKLIKVFFTACLTERKNDISNLINILDQFEMVLFLKTIINIDYIKLLFDRIEIQNKVKTFVDKYSNNITDSNYYILFLKKLFDISISNDEKKFLKNKLEIVREKRFIDWKMNNFDVDHLIISYTLDEYSFENFFTNSDRQYRYYNEPGLYSALYKGYLELLIKKRTLESLVRDYIRYINFYNEKVDRSYFKFDISNLWAYIIFNSDSDLSIKKNLKKILFKDDLKLNILSFYLKLFELSPDLFRELVDVNELNVFEDKLMNRNEDFSALIDNCFYLSRFFVKIDDEKAKFYFKKAINDGILRHGWRKDYIVTNNLVESLEIIWKNGWASTEKLIDYTNEVFKLAKKVSDVTDDSWRGPYNLIDMLVDYDIDFAEKLKDEIINHEGRYSFYIPVITSIIIGKIKSAIPIDVIEKEMEKYRKDYDYTGKPRSLYFEEKFKVYTEIASCDLYLDDEKIIAFKKAYEQIEQMRKLNIDEFLKERNYETEIKKFNELCDKYDSSLKLPLKNFSKKSTKVSYSEDTFLKKINDAVSQTDIAEIYDDLNDHNKEIILTKFESWHKLINKTLEINGNIDLFIKLLDKNLYPHMDWYISNSEFFHFGLSAALNNPDSENQIKKYLFHNTGHGGFFNIMKAYEVNNNKEMCIELFERFLAMCKLLVY